MVENNVGGEHTEALDPIYRRQVQSAILCIHQRDLDGATDACSAAIQRSPDRCEAYFLFAVVAYLLEDLGRSIEFAEKGYGLDPGCTEGCDILAHIHSYAGNLNDSVYYAKLSTVGDSNALLTELQVDGLDDLAKALNQGEEVSYKVNALRAFYQEDLDAAVLACEKELRLRQGDAELFLLYGRSLIGQGMFSRGVAAIHGALHLDSDNYEAYMRLGEGYIRRGERELAQTCFHQALDLSGNALEVLSVVSHYRHLFPGAWPMFDKAVTTWFKGASETSGDTPVSSNNKNDNICVGLLIDRACSSEELLYLESWFWQFDRNKVEIHVYSADKPADLAPVKLKSLAKSWINITEINEATLLDSMRGHDLDILVDVRVMCRDNHAGIVAAHPARKVVRWNATARGIYANGYDAVICDVAVKTKPSGGIDKIVSEAAAVCLPGDSLPKIEGKSPVHTMGNVTFGATCDLSHITPEVAMVWSQILRKIPGARLRLGNVGVVPPDVQSRLQEMFSAGGCVGHIDFEPLSSVSIENILVSRLEYFVGLDVFLDSFPNGGGIELASALWAGVPVIGHSKLTEPGSLGNGLLRAGGQDHWICKDDKTYIKKAVEAAKMVSDDPEWRSTMHGSVKDSRLFDTDAWGVSLNKLLSDIADL
jgi:protein O-GlcNAc transferase